LFYRNVTCQKNYSFFLRAWFTLTFLAFLCLVLGRPFGGDGASFLPFLSSFFSGTLVRNLAALLLTTLSLALFAFALPHVTFAPDASDSLSESEEHTESDEELQSPHLADLASAVLLILSAGGLPEDFLIVSRRPLVWELVTENSGDELRDDDSTLDVEVSESEESLWLEDWQASLPELLESGSESLSESVLSLFCDVLVGSTLNPVLKAAISTVLGNSDSSGSSHGWCTTEDHNSVWLVPSLPAIFLPTVQNTICQQLLC
jgi:hypothetical protein